MNIRSKMPTTWIVACMLFVAGQSYSAEMPGNNIVYGMYSGLALLMDVHAPEQPNGIGLIMIPGSGWEAPLAFDAEQLKHSYEIHAILGLESLVGAGYTVFVINHRATPRFRFPAPLEDAQRAVRFVRHHAVDFGIDPDRIGAIGGSSGGHLVNLLGTMNAGGIEGDSDPVNRHSARVQAVVAVYSVSDFSAFSTSNPWAGGAITALMGPVNPSWKPPPLFDATAAEQYAQASPATHVSADDPPFLLIHGDADTVVPFSQSEILQQRLRAAGVDVELIRIPNGDHGPGLLVEGAPDYAARVLAWLDSHLASLE